MARGGGSGLLVPLGILAGVGIVAALFKATSKAVVDNKFREGVQGALGGSGKSAAASTPTTPTASTAPTMPATPPAPSPPASDKTANAQGTDPDEVILDLAAAYDSKKAVTFPMGSKIRVVSSAKDAKWMSDPSSDSPQFLYQMPGTTLFLAIAPGTAAINAAWSAGGDVQFISQPVTISV